MPAPVTVRPTSLPAVLRVLAAAAFLAAPTRADFPLEDYLPADFHRHHLSVAPTLNGRLSAAEEEGSLRTYDEGDGRTGLGLDVNHGSVRRSRDRRWSLSSGLGLRQAVQGRGWERSDFRGDPLVSHKESFGRDAWNLDLSAFGRVDWQEYLGSRIFLAPSGGFDLFHAPWSGDEMRDWSLDVPLGAGGGADSAVYSENRQDRRSESLSARFAARVAVGVGRIEDVTFAETGLHVLDRLEEALGRRLRLSATEMRDLEAHVEARRKTRPFLDARAAAIHDVESLDGFLRGRLGLDALPARAVLGMADEWAQGGRHRRESGVEWTVYPFLSASWRDDRTRSDRVAFTRRLPAQAGLRPDTLGPAEPGAPGTTSIRDHGRGIRGERAWGLATRLAGRRPWRRAWQLDADLLARWSRIAREDGHEMRSDTAGGAFPSVEERRADYVFPRLEGAYVASATWYPHSRTEAGLTYRADIRRDFDLEGIDREAFREATGRAPDPYGLAWAHSFHFMARWFLSHRLALRGTLHAGSSGEDLKDLPDEERFAPAFPAPERHGVDWELSGNVGLIYYVF